MGASEVRSVGTLGSTLTFAGQATARLIEERAGYGVPTYYPTMDDVVAAVLDERIDVGVLTSETSNTACTDTAARILSGDPLFIVDEIIVPYRCALLGKPGSTLEAIRHVGGHGSIRQCRRFLAEQLPDAEVEIHAKNSVEAAREVLAGDGTRAVIATEAAAAEIGLAVIAADIDEGSVAGWWALAASPTVAAGSDHIAIRVSGSASLWRGLDRLRHAGFEVRTVTNAPTGRLFEYRYLVTARARSGVVIDEPLVEQFTPELVGAFRSTPEQPNT